MVRERPAKYLRNRIVIHPFFGASILDAPENRRAGGHSSTYPSRKILCTLREKRRRMQEKREEKKRQNR